MVRSMMSCWAFVLAASACGAQAPSDSTVYTLSRVSRLEVETGRAGVLGFLGHEHRVRARAFTGRVVLAPDSIAASRVEIVVLAESLEILTDAGAEDVRKMTAAMRTEVLDVASHPRITFVSRSIERARGDTLRIVGALTMRGRTRDVPVDVAVAVRGDTLVARARFSVKQTDFGIEPYRGGPLGSVQVADRVTFAIEAMAVEVRICSTRSKSL